MNEARTVVAIFAEREQARRAIQALKHAAFADEQIGLTARDGRPLDAEPPAATGTHAAEGALTGAAAGAGVGALWGLGILAGILPAIGPAIAGGTLAMLLSSAAAGAATAGVAGTLIGLGIPEHEARYADEEFRAGRVVVTVRADEREPLARSLLRRHGGYDVHTGRVAAPAGSAAGEAAGHDENVAETAAADVARHEDLLGQDVQARSPEGALDEDRIESEENRIAASRLNDGDEAWTRIVEAERNAREASSGNTERSR